MHQSNSAIEVPSLSADLDVRLIHAPSIAWALLLLMEGLRKLRCEIHDPPIYSAVVDVKASLLHDFFYVPVA